MDIIINESRSDKTCPLCGSSLALLDNQEVCYDCGYFDASNQSAADTCAIDSIFVKIIHNSSYCSHLLWRQFLFSFN